VKRKAVYLSWLVASCAVTNGALRGDSTGSTVDVHVAAEIAGGAGKVSVEIVSHADDAISVDVDSIRLRDGKGGRHAPLGAQQRFVRKGGEAVVRRVPYGAVNVSPGGRQTVALEFAELPPDAGYSLVVPALYKLGIEGQVGLKAIRVALQPAEAAPPSTGDGGFYDPFVE
jgi:hypothetical protein